MNAYLFTNGITSREPIETSKSRTHFSPPKKLSFDWIAFIGLIVSLAFCPGRAHAQGALTNGVAHDGAISSAAETDTWTIAANQGDRIIVQIAELSGGAGFTPRIELFAPDGAGLGVDSDGVAARLDIQAHVSGTFTVTVRDLNQTGTGTYRLRLAQVPGAFIVPAGDEGGPLVNGTNHQGTIDLGDLDLWTITANAGDRIILQIAELTGGASFTPSIELFAPNGARLGIQSGGTAARLDAQAAVGGTYTVLVSDFNQIGSGTYQLLLAQVPGGFVVPIGDEGGVLADAVNQDGTITLGDLDLWTFAAIPGDLVTLQITELSGGASFTPMIELFAPNGERMMVTNNATAATVQRAIDVGGTYTVLVSDANLTGAGTYRLNLTRGSIAPPGANVLTNGATSLGSISVAGQTNIWTFTASAGENILVRMGETTASTLVPWLRLYGPNGVLLTQDFNATAAEVAFRATNSGTFVVVAADGSGGGNQTGNYRISLAKTGSPLTISPTDEGGSLTNGVTYVATIDTGDIDAWTFTANAGENIIVRMGETTSGSPLLPWLRLYGPNGVLLSQDFNAAAAEVSARATNSGTFMVVATDGNKGFGGVGNYRISLAKTGSPLTISPSDEGGSLTNGASYVAAIDTGDIDVWTFTANAGENIIVRMGETVAASTLGPWLRLYDPNGVLLSEDFNAAVAEVTARATNSGTFMVVATDGNNGFGGVGNYRLSLAKTGSPLAISPADEGGSLTNGATYLATIDTGDIDAWTFTASAGENIIVRMGETAVGSTLGPWLRLYGPNGVLLSQDFNAAAAEVTARATNSGTFMVVATDGNNGFGGIGNYRISLAKTGSQPTISPSDEGGPLVNGTTYLATIDTGDIDAWTLTANAGENIVVRMGETTPGSTLLPWLRLYGPDGVLLSQDFNAAAAEVTARATNSGTFMVIATDGNNGFGGVGNYRISLAKTGSPLTISPTDEGGFLTNGATYVATIDTGDIDAWTFTANTGENIIVRMGETTSGSPLLPWLRLYGPNGVLLSENFNAAAAEVTFQATNSGTFMVIATDGNNGIGGVGNYRISLAKTGSPIVISPGDEGGSLTGVGPYDGTIDTGDLDIFTFTLCAGENIFLRVDELVVGSSLTPWIRLYGRDGILLNSAFGAATAQISRTAPTNGNYTVVIGDASSGFGGSGTYRLTATGLSEGLKLCIPIVISGTNVNLRGIGGVPSATFILFTHTNVTTPFASWSPIFTNQFDQFGVFSRTNPLIRTEPERYFRLIQQ